jgi:hypothetical protein
VFGARDRDNQPGAGLRRPPWSASKRRHGDASDFRRGRCAAVETTVDAAVSRFGGADISHRLRIAMRHQNSEIVPGAVAGPPYLPEIREEDAPAAIGRVYADIKRASGTPLVNLIYRHLATIPGGLEWVWGCIRMNWDYDGLLKAASALPSPQIVIDLPDVLWRTVGISEKDLGQIRHLVDHYNSTNAPNILGITALSRIIRHRYHASVDTKPTWTDAPRRELVHAGPPVPALDSLPPDVMQLLRFVNGLGETESPAVIASLFRHLTL